MNATFKRLFAPVWCCLILLASSVSAAEVTATYNAATDVPVTAASYTATGNTVNFRVNFTPQVGTNLTVVKNTGLALIQGVFDNLAQGQPVNLAFGGITYPFVANYYGGTGNDLVLQWADTKAYGWGNNASGQLGLSNTSVIYMPSAVTSSGVFAGKTIVSVSAGFYYTLALCADGTVAAWGKNNHGQLGNNSTADRNAPVDITGSGALAGKTVIAVSAGYQHSLALCSDGTVASWGDNGNGQLGNNSNNPSNVPVAVTTTGVLSGRKVIAISAGGYYSLALCSDGKAVSWGNGGHGQLGHGSIGSSSKVPVNVTSSGTLLGKTVTSISAGQTHAIALCSDGTLVAWGSNNYGETGGRTGGSPVLVNPLGVLAGKTVTAISAGYDHSLALCSDGTVAAWGGGPLGNGTSTDSSTPVAVTTTGVLAGKSITAIAAGYTHSAALCSDGTLAAWGGNSLQQLGNRTNSSSEIAPVAVLTNPFGARKCVTLVSGPSAYHTFALAALPSPSSDSTLSSLMPDAGTLTPTFASRTTSYSACVPASTASLTITPTASNPGASLTVNGAAVVSGSASQAIPLSVGTNTVNVTVTAMDGSATTYGITILRPSSLDVSFTSANTVPVSFPAYDATGLTAKLSLGFIPPNGTSLTLIKNTGLRFITGQFSNLTQGATVTLAYGGYNFAFVVDYFGGSGNDLVLRWANGKTYACGSNASGQLGNNNLSNSNLPATVLASGVLAGKTVTAIAVGESHTLVLCADGTVASWGSNTTGQLGNGSGGTNVVSKVPVSVVTSGALAGKTVAAIAAGSKSSYALCSDGTVVSWGDNSYGQLGNGTSSSGSYSKVPVAVVNTGVLADRPVAAIAAGENFCLALCADGRLAAWGLNTDGGLLGNNSSSGSGAPVAVNTSGWLADRTVAAISAGSIFSLALCSDGTLVSWGRNYSGTLGDNSNVDSRVPTRVNTLGALVGKTVTAISAGESHSFAVCSDGTIVAWGDNGYGKFGDNGSGKSSVPVVVPPFGALAGKTVSSIIAGSSHSFARCTDGTLAAWGNNFYGVMGNGGNAGGTTPVAVSASTLGIGERFASLSVGSMANHVVFTTAIPSEASLAGLTALSLGSGTLSPAFSSNIEAYTASVPNATNSITVTATALSADVGLTVNGIPVISGTPSPAIPLVEGPNVITVIATSPDGATVKSHTVTVTRGFILNATIASAISVPVTASGYTAASSVVNLSLGYAPATGATLTVINNTGPAFISGQFTNLAHLQTISLTYGNITYKFIANYYGGTGNDLVLQWASNKTYAWGNNFRGQLGNNSLTNSRVPVAVISGALSGKTIIRLASCSGHSLALCSDGTLAAWGYNLSGQLGDNSTSDSLVPIAARTTGVLAGKTIISIAAGESHSLVLCSDGTLAAWGSNNSGQLGIGNSSTSNSIVPVAVATNGALAGKTATAIAAGSAHNLALCSDGTLVAWGAGNNGQLGNGGADSKNTPFEVTRSGALAGKTVTSIAAGVAHSFALCSDGTLVSWGFNDHGQLGNNSTVNSLVPVAINSFGVLSGKSVTAIGAGGYHGLALRSDGVIASWGYNNSGQLGINSTTDSRLPVAVIATGALAGRTIKSIAGGDYHSLVHCTDGTMAGWGQNYAGQLGNNTLVNSGVPVLVSTSTLSTGEKFMSLAPSSTSAHSLAAVAVPLPSATGMAASNVRGTSATLIGRVNAIGNAVAVSFEYGLNTNYGKTITAVPASVAGFNNIVVSAGIGGLSPATTYHFRTVAACTGGTVRSADMTFTTLGDNAKLASLGLGTGALAPTFETLTTRYVATVPFTTDGVTVTPATEHPGAKVKVNGATVASGVASGRIELTVGNNLIQILVTAEDGETTRIYQIAVTRLPQEFVFDAASDIPVTADGFAAGDFPAIVRLGYVPAPGTVLTMVNNTGLEFIHGRFGNLAQGQRIALNHAGTTYDFVVNYFGGSGNDLVLQWADTKVMAWGSNSYGQLGDNSTTVRLSPVAVNESGALSGRTIVAVSGGYLHSLALCSDGTLAAWGYNVYGQLGDNGNAASSVPVAVDVSGVLAGRTVVAIATGPFHNLALCADGRVAAWGYNNHGQLGTGDKANLRAAGLVEPVGALSGKQVVAVAAGAYHSFALCSDGTLAAWGYNDEGELGDGTNAGSLTPVAVGLSGRRVVSISAGQYHTLALCTDGSLLAWGYNNRGQLGNGRILASNIPLDIGNFGALSGKSISAIAAGGSHSLALLTDGTLAAWGYNHRGQLGATGVTQSTTPIAIADSNILVGRTIAGIVTGGNHNLVRCTDDTLAAWGDNANGQLGNKLTVTGPLPGLVDTGAMVAGARPMFGASGAAASHNLVVIGLPTGSSSAPGQIHFANSAAGADLEDPDQDGISNLLEYAFGLDPNENSAGQLPQPKRVGDHYVLGFTQPDGVTGITYSAEWSATLQQGSWTSVPDSGIGAEHVFSVPAGMEPKIFMRLKVVTQN